MSSLKVRLIGKHILAARDLLGLTQAQLAEVAGVTEKTIMNFEKGHHEPRPETVEAIRDALVARGIEFRNGDNPGVQLFPERATVTSP